MPNLTRDQLIENKIMRRTIRAFLDAGYLLTVHDGEEDTLKLSDKPVAIFKALKTTDEDWLICHATKQADGGVYEVPQRMGWVRFVYGNAGYEVVCDYSTRLGSVMEGVMQYAETLEY